MYNTKLTPEQKFLLKKYKGEMTENMAFAHVPEEGLTVLVKVYPDHIKVTTSLASRRERKFRKKVGELLTLNRMNLHEYLVMPNKYLRQGLHPEAIADLVATDLAYQC